ncbi:MAG: hypothetical protein R3C52_06615 [Hyphomonadaceae bacterium]
MSLRVGTAWTLLVLVALILRAGVAPGFMPSFNSSSGEVEITMCSAGAGHEVEIVKLPGDAPTSPLHDESPCPLAVATAPVLPDAPLIVAARAIYAFEYAHARPEHAPSAAPWSAHAPPTGPPSLA